MAKDASALSDCYWQPQQDTATLDLRARFWLDFVKFRSKLGISLLLCSRGPPIHWRRMFLWAVKRNSGKASSRWHCDLDRWSECQRGLRQILARICNGDFCTLFEHRTCQLGFSWPPPYSRSATLWSAVDSGVNFSLIWSSCRWTVKNISFWLDRLP